MKKDSHTTELELKKAFEHLRQQDALQEIPSFDAIMWEKKTPMRKVWHYVAVLLLVLTGVGWWTFFPVKEIEQSPSLEIIITYEKSEEKMGEIPLDQSMGNWESETDILLTGL